jgi:methylated-DNA-[protein]-cysteine S-methyltransferase
MEFADRVYAITQRIPKGKVSTYGAIARALNNKGYRAVGRALHVNPFAPKIPCHRVVSSDGSLGGFASGLQKKAKMLRAEGVDVKNGKIDLHRFGISLKKRKGPKPLI